MTHSDHALDEAMGDLLHGRMIDDTAHERPIGSLADAALTHFRSVAPPSPRRGEPAIHVEPAAGSDHRRRGNGTSSAVAAARGPLDDLSQAPAPAPGP